MKIKRIEHVAIAVKNLDATRDIFAKLGITCSHEETLAGPGVRLAMLPIGESNLELLESHKPGNSTDNWIQEKGEGLYHICLEVDNIHAALDELREKGVGLLDQVPRSGHGGNQIAFLDPASTGNVLVELVEMTAGGH